MTRYESLDDWLWKTRTTQTELARRVRMTEPQLSELLALKRGCSVHTALALAKATGVPVEKLVPWAKILKARKARNASKNRTPLCA